MKCPNCNVTLVMTDRSGIEIDYCPDCRGVWLDRGELDKIIERSSQNVKNKQHDSYAENDNIQQIVTIVIKRKKDYWENCLIFNAIIWFSISHSLWWFNHSIYI